MGRVFCKRMYRATCGKKSPHDHIRITRPLKADLQIWLQFLQNFNGRSIWQDDFVTAESLNLFTDSAGSIGYGAYFHGHWSAESWPDLWVQLGFDKNILLLELFPVLVALVIWGESFRHKHIILHSDNKGVVFAINCLSAKSPPVITMLRKIVLHCLEFNVWLKASYLALRPPCFGDFFIHKNRSVLTKFQFNFILKSSLRYLNLDVFNFTSHSFRIGAATEAARLGLDSSLIKRLGRWESDRYRIYVRPNLIVSV